MSTNNKTKYNEDSIRLAAYYNWQNAGCPNGKDEYFWNQAIKQLYGTCTKSSSCSCNKTAKQTTTVKASTSSKTTSSKASAKTSTTKKSSSKK